MKSFMLGGIVLAVLILMTASGKTLQTRYIFAVLSILTFFFLFVWAFYEYDNERTKAWKRKEKRLNAKI